MSAVASRYSGRGSGQSGEPSESRRRRPIGYLPGIGRSSYSGFRVLNRGLELVLEAQAQAPQGPMQGDVDYIPAPAEQVCDLAPVQARVVQRHELAIALAEPPDLLLQRQPVERPLLEVVVSRRVVVHERHGARLSEPLVYTPSRDADEPGAHVALARIEAALVLERANEDLARDVFGVGPGAEPVGRVRVDPADQRLGVGEGVAAKAHHASTARPPRIFHREAGRASSACVRTDSAALPRELRDAARRNG